MSEPMPTAVEVSISNRIIEQADGVVNRLQQIRINLNRIEERLFGAVPANIGENAEKVSEPMCFIDQLSQRTSNQFDLIDSIESTINHLSEF